MAPGDLGWSLGSSTSLCGALVTRGEVFFLIQSIPAGKSYFSATEIVSTLSRGGLPRLSTQSGPVPVTSLSWSWSRSSPWGPVLSQGGLEELWHHVLEVLRGGEHLPRGGGNAGHGHSPHRQLVEGGQAALGGVWGAAWLGGLLPPPSIPFQDTWVPWNTYGDSGPAAMHPHGC